MVSAADFAGNPADRQDTVRLHNAGGLFRAGGQLKGAGARTPPPGDDARLKLPWSARALLCAATGAAAIPPGGKPR